MSYPPSSYPQPYPPGPGGKLRLRGRTPLRLALIFFIVAVALFVAGGVVAATKSLGKVNDFERVKLDSTATITVNRTGNYVAYYEASDVDNNIKTVPIIPVALQSPSGQVRRLTKLYGGLGGNKVKILTYQYNHHNGAALYQFTISEKGQYKVLVGGSSTAPAGADIAFGESIASGTIVAGLLIVGGVLFLITAIILLIVGLVKRSRHKKQLQSGYGYGGYPPGPPPGAPPAQQWPQQDAPGQSWPQHPQQPPGGDPQRS